MTTAPSDPPQQPQCNLDSVEMRPILPYRSPLRLIPAPDQEVWIRRLPWYDTPVRGQSAGTDGCYVISRQAGDDFLPAPIELSWSQIHSWKFQYLADEEAYRAARQPGWPP
jgi:hypothetical protein